MTRAQYLLTICSNFHWFDMFVMFVIDPWTQDVTSKEVELKEAICKY